jgi:hypothetical protein
MAERTTEPLLLRGITAEHVAAVTTGRRLHGFPSDGGEAQYVITSAP